MNNRDSRYLYLFKTCDILPYLLGLRIVCPGAIVQAQSAEQIWLKKRKSHFWTLACMVEFFWKFIFGLSSYPARATSVYIIHLTYWLTSPERNHRFGINRRQGFSPGLEVCQPRDRPNTKQLRRWGREYGLAIHWLRVRIIGSHCCSYALYFLNDSIINRLLSLATISSMKTKEQMQTQKLPNSIQRFTHFGDLSNATKMVEKEKTKQFRIGFNAVRENIES